MTATCLATAIAAAEDDFAIELGDTAAQQREAFRLRHQVYCVERGYEACDGDIETDEFDAHARHVLLRHRASGEVVGTVRLVMPRRRHLRDSFPMQRVCDPSAFDAVPLRTSAEISRFSLSKNRRLDLDQAGGLMRLALVRGLVQATDEAGLTHWCAVMERSLLRLLRMTAIHLEPAGPMVEYHGMRQPAACNVDVMLGRVRRENAPVWDYLTQGGRLWAPQDEAMAA